MLDDGTPQARSLRINPTNKITEYKRCVIDNAAAEKAMLLRFMSVFRNPRWIFPLTTKLQMVIWSIGLFYRSWFNP